MRCEGTHFGVIFFLSAATRRQALRAMHACSRSSRGGERNGFEPPFWGDFGLCWPSEKSMLGSTHSTLAVVQDSICAVVCLPLAPYTQARKTSDRKNSWTLAVGFVENDTLISSSLRGLNMGVLRNPRPPEPYPDHHYHPRHVHKPGRCHGRLLCLYLGQACRRARGWASPLHAIPFSVPYITRNYAYYSDVTSWWPPSRVTQPPWLPSYRQL